MITKIITATAILALSAPVAAAQIAIFNTGVDAAGVATTGHGVDLHWTLAGGTAFTGATNGSFPINPWLAETTTSRWITPTTNAAASVSPGLLVFSETFSLTGLNAATAQLSGQFAGDNNVTAVFLNGNLISTGHPVLNVAANFGLFKSFSAGSSAFVAGTNTLTFNLGNSGGPAGLRVEVSGTADANAVVPEPAMWSLMIAGFGLVGVATRRRSRIIAA